MTLGSLFDGIGGFPLAGMMCGITPVWSSEIEPFPLKVTAARFPEMEQLGSVTDIDGAKVEPVDIITFGSPCQDLSVAGKQLGIHEGQRSNLFFEAVRIIKEMRNEDRANGRSGVDIRPRFAVWENVPGAFSSNKGQDFRAVLEALASVRQDGISIPQPKKWGGAGCVVGDGWSLAWRVYDAQYWGVPQRRKRIYLVADFATERAAEILFKSESVRGNPAQSGAEREGTAADAEGGVGGSCIAFKERAGKPGGGKGILPAIGRAFTLATNVDQSVVYEPKSLMEENWAAQDVKNALRANGSKSGSCVVERTDESGGIGLTNRGYVSGDKAETLRAESHMALPCVVHPADFMGGQGAKAGGIGYCDDGTTPTLKASPSGGNTVPDVCYALQGNGIDRADTAGCNGAGWRENEMYTLNTIDRPAVVYPELARSLTARHDSSPCVDRGQNVVVCAVDCRNMTFDAGKTHCLQAHNGGGYSLNCTPSVIYDARGNGDGNTTPTLTGDHQNRVTDYTALAVGNGQLHQTELGDKTGALNCMHDQQAVVHEGKPPRKYIVRRLTHTEYARLQGMPDWWCEGLGGSDSAIYKAYGNGLALPCAYDVLRRIVNEYEKTSMQG